jgi:hypothetical protein
MRLLALLAAMEIVGSIPDFYSDERSLYDTDALGRAFLVIEEHQREIHGVQA